MGNYPPGAADDPRAPWNWAERPEETFAVRVFYGLERTADVCTDRHDDGEMEDAAGDYEEQYLTPLQLFDFARKAAGHLLAGHDFGVAPKPRLRRVVESCDGWETTCYEAEQERD